MTLRALIVAVALAAAPPGPGRTQPAADRFAAPAGIEFPNGVAALPDGSVLAGGGGGGAIWRLSPDGRWTVYRDATPEIASISSLRYDAERDVLWGAAPDIRGAFSPGADPRAVRAHRVYALNATTGRLRFSATVPDGGFANDLALDGEGGTYLTDSLKGRVWRVSAEGRFSVAAEDPRFRNGPLGPSGLARLPDGDLVVGLFSAGELYRVSDPGPRARVARIFVERSLARPDGLAALPDGRLLLIEGGRGALHALDLSTGRLDAIASGLVGPVNLSVRGEEVWVTESGVNDPAAFDPTNPPRDQFAVRRVRLPEGAHLSGELPLPPERRYPNGIAWASDGSLFVGLVTSGEVLRRTPDGRWSTFFPGSDKIYAGTSLRLDEARSLLWGASPDFLPGAQARPHRLFALDTRTGVVRRTLLLPDGGFGNDLALAPDGDLYVTDSRNGRVLRLPAEADRLQTVVEHPALKPVDRVGAGGIVRAPDGRLVVGNYETGKLFVIEGADDGRATLTPVRLPRRLENPDGLAFAPDGSLLVLEGAVRSGDGKLLRVPEPFGAGLRSVEVLRAGLPSPLNLSVGADGLAYVTLSRIRHRLIPGQANSVPARFGVLPIAVPNMPVEGDRP